MKKLEYLISPLLFLTLVATPKGFENYRERATSVFSTYEVRNGRTELVTYYNIDKDYEYDVRERRVHGSNILLSVAFDRNGDGEFSGDEELVLHQ